MIMSWQEQFFVQIKVYVKFVIILSFIILKMYEVN